MIKMGICVNLQFFSFLASFVAIAMKIICWKSYLYWNGDPPREWIGVAIEDVCKHTYAIVGTHNHLEHM